MRLKKLVRLLAKNSLMPCLITDLINIRYLTGFTGSHAYMLITASGIYFISDSRYEEYARSILPRNITFIRQEGPVNEVLKPLLVKSGTKKLFIEDTPVSVGFYEAVKRGLRGISVKPAPPLVKDIRMIKEPGEIEILRKAAAITDRCFSHILKTAGPGMTEWELSLEIEMFYKRNGCRRNSFDTIAASGAGSSMPHYETSMKKKIRKGDVLLIDMGCEYEGYNSDLTRTVFMGSVDPFMRKIYGIVAEAQTRAIAAVKSGAALRDVDRKARGFIERAGYGENFGHSLGHGFGLEVHEAPALKDTDGKLKSGMTVTIEPGIYVPGRGGVRIEDMVLVTADGREVLTRSSKKIITIEV
jgi:Xaa-Pro aminopeptidase